MILFAAASAIGVAQIEIGPQDAVYTRLVKRLDRAQADHERRPLSCRVEAIPPRLGYSFRFFAGFTTSFPVRQFRPGKDNRMAAIFRVTSETTGEKHYFFQPMELPTIPENPPRILLEIGGGIYLGEGNYMVDWALGDQQDRVCTRSWMVKTPKTKVSLLVPPGSIQPLGLETWKGFGEKKTAANNAKVTVFLSAMPLYRRRSLSKLPPYDLAVLLSSLTSVLDSTRYGHARVVVFDLLGKRILFEQDEFDPAGYQMLRDKLENASYGTIDYQTLARGINDRRLFEQMIKDEAARPHQSDAIVFLGAEGPPSDRLPPVFGEYRQGFPRLYYVFFQRFRQPAQDIMYQFVHGGKGKIVNLFAPRDLVNAIRAIDST